MIRQLMRFLVVPFLNSLGAGGKQDHDQPKWLVAPSNKTLRFCLSCMVLLLTLGAAQAQTGKYTVNGYIKDESSGEVLINATITFNPPAWQ